MGRKWLIIVLLLALIGGVLIPVKKAHAAQGIELYTPYSGISVTPGESISYSFEVMNHTSVMQQVQIQLDQPLDDWNYSITSGGWDLKRLTIKPGGSEKITMDMTVPLEVEKGDYQFSAVATSDGGLKAVLPMEITVSEKGTFKTELTSEQPNLEGHADSSFEYTAELKNRTAEAQHYGLVAGAPRGWNVDFKVDGKSVTSVTVESNSSKDISISVTPATDAKTETYKIPIKAANESTSSELILEAAITGTYGMEFTTPTGKLSEDITAGAEKSVELVVKNTGSVPLTDVSLSAANPQNWKVQFEPKKINKIEPGQSETIHATINASKDAIAGDYVVELNAASPEVSSKAQMRMTVKTSILWGWFGILIILGVIGYIVYLIRKYGRR